MLMKKKFSPFIIQLKQLRFAILNKKGVTDPSYVQLNYLRKSVIGRMSCIICDHLGMYGQAGANKVYKKFISSVIYDKQLENALNN